MTQNKKKLSNKKFQRKTILIKKGLQYKYMILIIASVLIAFLIVSLDIIWTLSKFVNEHPMLQPLLADMKTMIPLFGIKIVIYLIIVIIVSAVVSHRMAGPIYKFEKSATIVGNGDLTHRVTLRKGDHLGDLQDSFNRMAASIQKTVISDRTIVRGASESLKKLSEKITDAETKKEILQVCQNLDKTFNSLKIQ